MADVNYTVPNLSTGTVSTGDSNYPLNRTTYTGDWLVKQYTSITINNGDTVKMAGNGAKGMLLYCQGDCTINGTLSCQLPQNTTTGFSGTDVTFTVIKSGGTDSGAPYTTGMGSDFISAVGNNPTLSGNGVKYVLGNSSTNRSTGGAGGQSGGNWVRAGGTATAGLVCGGGGGGGAMHSTFQTNTPYTLNAANNGNGCIGGVGFPQNGQTNYQNPSSGGGGGGAGSDNGNKGSGWNSGVNGTNGAGGLLVLVIGGNFSGSGTITAAGANGGAGSNGFYGSPHGHGNFPASSGGGGSGGGNIWIFKRSTSTDSFSGTITVAGGTGGTASQSPGTLVSSGSSYGDNIYGSNAPVSGSNGGNGAIVNTTIA